jgi:hypothetical protein
MLAVFHWFRLRRAYNIGVFAGFLPQEANRENKLAQNGKRGTGVGEGPGIGVGVTAQVTLIMVFVSNVTAPFCANTLPSTVAPVVSVADVKTRIFPLKVVVVPSIAELPTCQKTLQSWASFIRLTLLADAVVSVEPIWKMKTALGSPRASSTSVPVN